MNSITKIIGASALLLAVAGVSGCGGAPQADAPVPASSQPASAPTPTPESTWTPAEEAFWTYVMAHTTRYDEDSKAGAIKAGHSICDALGQASGDKSASDVLVEMDVKDHDQQMIVVSAAINLCGTYADEVQTFYANGGTKAYEAKKAKAEAQQKAEEKRDKAIRARAKKSKNIEAWVDNQSKHAGLVDDFNAADAAVDVCNDMRTEMKGGATEDDAAQTAAENFASSYLDQDAISTWSPNPEGTMEAWSGSFVEEVLYSGKTSMCKN